MLHSISWGAFIRAVLVLMALYYVVVCSRYYRKEIMAFLRRRGRKS